MNTHSLSENYSLAGLYELMEIALERLARIESFQERLMRIETKLEKDRIARINSQITSVERRNISIPPILCTGLSLDLFPTPSSNTYDPPAPDNPALSHSTSPLEKRESSMIDIDSESSLSDISGSLEPVEKPKRRTGRPKKKPALELDDAFIAKVRSKSSRKRFIKIGHIDSLGIKGPNRLVKLLIIQAGIPSLDDAQKLFDQIIDICRQRVSEFDPSIETRLTLYKDLERMVDTKLRQRHVRLKLCVDFWAAKCIFRILSNRGRVSPK